MVLPPRHGLSLCAGGGGLDMGLELAEPGFATSCYVEIEEYPRSTLIAGQRAGYLKPAPIWDDLKQFNARPWGGQIDTLLAGYPCQPFSQAGQRKGENDPRHLWPDIVRIIRELGDGLRWCFFENVSGHLTLGLETVVNDLRELGFDTAVGLFSAQETGATHERQRVFIVAHSQRQPCERRGKPEKLAATQGKTDGQTRKRKRNGYAADNGSSVVAHADGRHASPERKQRSGQQRLQPESGGTGAIDVDDTTGARCDRARFRAETDSESRERLLGHGRSELANPECQPGHQGGCAGTCDCDTDSCGQTILPGSSRPLVHPPAPNDREGWIYTLPKHPEGAPALSLGDLSTFSRYFAALIEAGELSQAEAEQRLCRMADGLATRSRSLRLLGNGVHPLAAGHAWRTLAAAHGLGCVDLGTQ